MFIFRVRVGRHLSDVGRHLSDVFPIKHSLKQGDALSPLIFNFFLEYAIRGVQVNTFYINDVLLFKCPFPGPKG